MRELSGCQTSTKHQYRQASITIHAVQMVQGTFPVVCSSGHNTTGDHRKGSRRHKRTVHWNVNWASCAPVLMTALALYEEDEGAGTASR